jgi:hypothetical protein
MQHSGLLGDIPLHLLHHTQQMKQIGLTRLVELTSMASSRKLYGTFH